MLRSNVIANYKHGIFFEVRIPHQNLQRMRTSRNPSTINAGSMADIAFLLLLFFLVATTISQEKGIARKLPAPCPTGLDCNATIAEHNLLRILLNEKGAILVNNEVLPLASLKDKAVQFLDNNRKGACDYCYGSKNETESDHPKKAVISLSSHRLSSYASFISVQDELTKAYKELRTRYASEKYGKPLKALSEEELKAVQQAYPFIVSEVTIQ